MGLYEIEEFVMDTTQIFYSRPSYLSSFKIYHPKELNQSSKSHSGGYMPGAYIKKGVRNFTADVLLPFAAGLSFMIGNSKRKV